MSLFIAAALTLLMPVAHAESSLHQLNSQCSLKSLGLEATANAIASDDMLSEFGNLHPKALTEMEIDRRSSARERRFIGMQTLKFLQAQCVMNVFTKKFGANTKIGSMLLDPAYWEITNLPPYTYPELSRLDSCPGDLTPAGLPQFRSCYQELKIEEMNSGNIYLAPYFLDNPKYANMTLGDYQASLKSRFFKSEYFVEYLEKIKANGGIRFLPKVILKTIE